MSFRGRWAVFHGAESPDIVISRRLNFVTQVLGPEHETWPLKRNQISAHLVLNILKHIAGIRSHLAVVTTVRDNRRNKIHVIFHSKKK
jgi:hypothetical protein